MFTTRKGLWTQIAVFGTVLALGVSCGKKKDDDNDDGGGKKQPTEVKVTATVTEEAGDVAVVKYKSPTIKDATFQCKTEEIDPISGATLSGGEWDDCPEEGLRIQKAPGRMYIVKIKAVSPDGRESEIKETRIGALDSNVNDPIAGLLQTVILNKADVGNPYTQRTLVLQFGIEAPQGMQGQAMPQPQVMYECKRDGETQWRQCATQESPEYDFDELVDGAEYSLAVRARDLQTGAEALEDSVSFRVDLPDLAINGTDQLAQMAQDRAGGFVDLTYDIAPLGGDAVRCTLNPYDQQPEPLQCDTSRLSLPLQGMRDGANLIRIEVLNGQEVISSKEVPFCYGGDCGGPTQNPDLRMQIGGNYMYRLPPDEHLTQWSTETVPGSRNYFLQILRSSDASFHTVRTCNTHVFEGQQPVTLGNYNYCESSPTADQFKAVTNFGYALNHMESATDDGSERVLINAFSDGWDYHYTRSFFHRLCGKESLYGRTNLTVTPEPLRFAPDFWEIGGFQKARFFSCAVMMPSLDFTSGRFGSPEAWWIGVFYLEVDDDVLPDFKCFEKGYNYHDATAGIYCDQYSNKNVVEVVYAARRDVVDNPYSRFEPGFFDPRLEHFDPAVRFAILASYRFKKGLYRFQ